ncbi:hypothetical protein [Candidatus Halobonum tyrrellensis]|uniref:Uncharacterized protein n=1 Tax=Candidatus Halobonum tyrrellensis G22 TaxID=1324957 RepID=V4J2U6_9EURY|nr:hypothetical protein [Candidatus Halobonum tyrrellensis]ESP89717.1 hypothetical protein K933_01981 [Candidatus Halobonum tyrrellensis G22]
MSMPTKRENPPDILTEILDDLDAATLRSVRTYVERRLDDVGCSMVERICSETEGAVVDIEYYGPYTLVWKYPPDGDDGETKPLSLYRVTREWQVDGTESLHWSYLGEASEQPNGGRGNHDTTASGHATTHPRYEGETNGDDGER